MEETIPVLLVTANVGSIFEDPDAMVGLWIQEFIQTVSRFDVKFVALHCQEVGGKNYETRMQHVDNFVQLLVSSEKLKSFNRAVVFLDEDFSCAENFTALGNFYFIHESAKEVYLWNFKKQKYDPIEGKKVYSGNIEDIEVKEKSKFPQNFFPECKWSRKGYLRTRWSIDDSIFDLVNIHLFHDASNFVAMQSYPSVYTVTRQKALQYTLNRFYNYTKGYAPFFLFGDFNFRTDTQGVVKKLTTGLNECKDNEFNNDDTRLEYKDESSEVVVSIGKKEFSHNDHQNVFINDSAEWLKEFDREMEAFKDQLFEFPITFLPSYPFEENCSNGQSYMKTRCPAWCDRVLLSMTAKQLIHLDEDNKNIEYGVIGKDSCMGDHKPVYLFVHLKSEAGIISPKLPLPKVCSACKLSSSVFCDAFLNSSNGESPMLSVKSHFSSTSSSSSSFPRGSNNSNNGYNYETSCANSYCKMYHRNLVATRHEANISPMSTVTELSDRLSDTDTDSYYLASAIPTLNSSSSMDICSKINDSCSNSFNDAASSSPLAECDIPLPNTSIAVTVVDDAASLLSSQPHATSSEIVDDELSAAKIKRHHFAEDNMSFNRYHHETSKEFVSRSFDETTPVRSNSALNVIEGSWRSKTCNCLQDTGWRMRSISSSSRTSSWNSDSRVRLKSDPNLKMSLPRIQSHHSSSDEEWFEEVAENSTETASNTELEISRKTDPAIEEIEECIEFDATPSADQAARVPLTQQNSDDKDSYKKSFFLFCIPKRWRPKETRVKELSDCKLKKGRYFRFLSSKSRRCRLCCAL
ncbi:uncharacterized protein 5PtaseI [Planococcus citri]|uniref:uncharacterized protein 5PtaseI n=1 Tax=Planococcus citri TaxID=170843 RepID=UPI0031F7BFEE